MLGLENTGFLGGKLAMACTATTWVPFAEAHFTVNREGRRVSKEGHHFHPHRN